MREGKLAAAKERSFRHQHGHDYLEQLKSWFPIARDTWSSVLTLRTIITELGFLGRYHLKTCKVREHVIFKGFAGAARF